MRFYSVLIVALLACCSLFGQADTIFVIESQFGSYSTVNDTIYQVSCTHGADDLGQGFNGNGIREGYFAFDVVGNIFRVDSILSQNAGASTLWLAEQQNSIGPVGTGIIYRSPDSTNLIPEIPYDNLSHATLAKIHNHNVVNGGSGGGSGGSGSTNLAYTTSATDGTVTSDTGTDATIPAGSTTNASLMLPGDKTKLDGIESGATVDQTAAEVPITDAGGYFVATDVEAALQEEAVNRLAVDAIAGDLVTLSGVPLSSEDLGTFTGSTISDNNTVKGALQELETYTESKLDTVIVFSLNDTTFVVHNYVAGAIVRADTITISGTGGGGGGGVTGSGTTNYMPVWSGASALTDSPVYVDGDSLGIGTTSPDASVLHLRSTQTADQSVALLMEVPITANAAYGLGWKESGRTPFFGIQSSNMNTSSGASLQYDYIDKSTPANSSEEILTVFPNRVYINPSSSSTATYGQTLEFGNGKDVIHGFADLRLGSLAGITIEPDRNNNEGDTNWGFRMKPNNASTVTWLLAQNGSMSFSSANPSYTIDAATRTDGFRFAGGTTAQRPVGVNRLMRYNTTWNGFDIHNGTEYLRLLALQDVDPTDGQVPIWSAANSRWEPGTASGGMTSFTLETDDTNPITISDGDELEINGGVGIITTDVAVGEGAVISLDLETMPTNGTPDGDFQFVTYDINGVEESLTDIDEISDYVLNNLPLESTLGLLRQTQATAFELARGTTGERPLATTAFRLRGNTSTSKLEMSNGTDYDNIATEDYVDTEIAGLEPDVSFTSDSDLAIFPNKPVEHVTLETTSGASSDTNLSLPTAGVAYAGYQVVVWSVDLSGSHDNTISATTIQNGATTSGSISLNNYQSTTVSCILVGASTYRWVVTNQY